MFHNRCLYTHTNTNINTNTNTNIMPQPNNNFSSQINNSQFNKKLEKMGFKKQHINSFGNNYSSPIYGSINTTNGTNSTGNSSVQTKSLFDF